MNYFKNKVIRYLVKNLLVALTADDILTFTNKGWYIHKRRLSDDEVMQLKDEAQMLKDSVLWKLISNEIRFLANTRMFEKSAAEGNSVFGRAMLYNVDIIENFLDRCKKL